MKCSQCIAEGKSSRVMMGTQTSTLAMGVSYCDEGGCVFQDPNIHTTSYTCTNGHSFSESGKSTLAVHDMVTNTTIQDNTNISSIRSRPRLSALLKEKKFHHMFSYEECKEYDDHIVFTNCTLLKNIGERKKGDTVPSITVSLSLG